MTTRLETIRACLAMATPGPWRFGTSTLFPINDGSYDGLRHLPSGQCLACVEAGTPPDRIVAVEGHDEHYHRLELPLLPGDGYAPDDTGREAWYPWRCLFSEATFGAILGNYDCDAGGVASSRYDAELIRHAPEDLAFLLNEVERLQTRLDGLVSAVRAAARPRCSGPVDASVTDRGHRQYHFHQTCDHRASYYYGASADRGNPLCTACVVAVRPSACLTAWPVTPEEMALDALMATP